MQRKEEGVMTDQHTYIAIDLKSFYASVECIERGLDPLTTNLVVADASRTNKTICLAVSPSLKAYGISGRPRLFEVVRQVRKINIERKRRAQKGILTEKSYDDEKLRADSALELDYIVAPPRMAHYITYSTKIYEVYLQYVSPEDIHIYSIDEVFIDVTAYLDTYQMTAKELARTMLLDVLKTTGITAAAGIGTNLYLCKVAMDIVAKHIPADEYGVRIAGLDELSYRKLLWNHRPLTDFWRIGKGYAKKLEAHGLYTMGDVARCSIGQPQSYYNEELLYRLFGINAELLIDHAWGWEPCTIADIKTYKPQNHSLGSGQVLHSPYSFEKARIVVKEMTDLLSLDLVDQKLVTDQMVLTVGYDIENLTDAERRKAYHGEVVVDSYGREIPKHAHGSINLERQTSSTMLMTKAVTELYDKIVDPNLLVRRIHVVANHVMEEGKAKQEESEEFQQLDLFTDYGALQKEKEQEEAALAKEKEMQKAVLCIKKKFGKNAILKGMSLQEGATAKDKNNQIGGHRA